MNSKVICFALLLVMVASVHAQLPCVIGFICPILGQCCVNKTGPLGIVGTCQRVELGAECTDCCSRPLRCVGGRCVERNSPTTPEMTTTMSSIETTTM